MMESLNLNARRTEEGVRASRRLTALYPRVLRILSLIEDRLEDAERVGRLLAQDGDANNAAEIARLRAELTRFRDDNSALAGELQDLRS